MDFGAFPPEINSGRMYTGPGSTPMLTATTAWKELATELRSTAASYQSIISGLTADGWRGPTSVSMAAAAAPYATWMHATAEQAEHTAVQAHAASSAYEAAYAMTVPPPVIAANRALQLSLIATNFLGHNSAAIAATEAQYGEMWAQDAGAMYGYAGDSAAASKVAPFSAPPKTANGPPGNDGSDAQTLLSLLHSEIPGLLQGLSSPGPITDSGSGSSGMVSSLPIPPGEVVNGMTNLASGMASPLGLSGITTLGADIAVIRGAALAAADPLGLGALDSIGFGSGASALSTGASGMAGLSSAGAMSSLGTGAFGSSAGLSGLNGSAMSAGMNRGTLVGALSVPPNWPGAGPSTAPPVTASLQSSPTGAVSGHGLPGMPAMATQNQSNGVGNAMPRYGFRPLVVGRPPAAG